MADRVVSLHSTASSFSHVALLLPSNHGDCMQTWSVVVLIALSRGWWGTATIQVIYIYKMTTYLCIALIWSYIFSELSLFLCKYKHDWINQSNLKHHKICYVGTYTYTPHPIYLQMQLKFQSCFEIKSRRIIMCVRQVFCQWFIIFYWSECPSWFVIIVYSFM